MDTSGLMKGLPGLVSDFRGNNAPRNKKLEQQKMVQKHKRTARNRKNAKAARKMRKYNKIHA